MSHARLPWLKTLDGGWLYLICVFISLALFATSLFVDNILNDDGIDYIYAAYEYLKGDRVAARSFRPEQLFYSQIGILTKYTGLTLVQSAFTLSLLAQVALMCGFLAITRVLGGSTSVQLLAIMVIASLLHFNEHRPHIIKGFGFWACHIWALWAIIRFSQSSHWRYLFGWLALSSLSMLFRIEGIVYIAGLAIIIPLLVKGAARRRFLLAGIVIFVGTLTIASINQLYFNKDNYRQVSHSKKLDIELARASRITDTLDKQKELIRDTMPNKWARDSASRFLIGGLLFEFTSMLFITTNGVLLGLSLLYGKVKILPRTVDHKLIASYFMIGLLIGLYTVASRFFVTGRYLFLPALLLCIPIPFLLAQILLNQSKQSWARHYILRTVIFIIPTLTILTPIIKANDDKMYIPQAATWLKSNVSASDSIYYNDQKLAFYGGDYANHSFKMDEVSFAKLQAMGFQYAVIHSRKSLPLSNSKLLANSDENIKLVHRTAGQRNAEVNVYKILALGGLD